MSKNQTLDEFYIAFREEVLCASDTETSGWTIEDFLTNVMMEYLEEAGEVSGILPTDMARQTAKFGGRLTRPETEFSVLLMQ